MPSRLAIADACGKRGSAPHAHIARTARTPQTQGQKPLNKSVYRPAARTSDAACRLHYRPATGHAVTTTGGTQMRTLSALMLTAMFVTPAFARKASSPGKNVVAAGEKSGE